MTNNAKQSRRPDQALTPIEWFVEQMASDLELGDRPIDIRCRTILLRLTHWTTNQGVALHREVVLDPAVVEQFCTVELANDRSQATYRSDLRRMGRRLTVNAPWEPRPVAMATRQIAAPYSPGEIAMLRRDVVEQPTPARLRGGRVLLALGLGAGLDGRWAARITGSDIVRRGPVFEVETAAPAPRRVVVRADWEEEIQALAAEAGAEPLIGRHPPSKNRVAHVTKRLVFPAGHPVLSPPRLRSTWLLTLLDEGVRLPELCAVAGIKGFTAFADLMPYFSPLDQAVADEMLRGTA
jgi:hypothetical protein